MRHEATLLHELPLVAADRTGASAALHDGARTVSYSELATDIRRFASALAALGVGRGERVAIYLDKRLETVVASFGAPAHGAVFVPINPLLKPEQVAYILRDCDVRVLVTSAERLACWRRCCGHARTWRTWSSPASVPPAALPCAGVAVHALERALDAPPRAGHRVIDTDMVGILYTSGSTGKPKGVVLSHRNMVAGAKSVASLPREPRGRHAAGGAAAVVRRRVQPAHDGLSRRRAAWCC